MRLIDADEAKKFYKENLILPEKSHEIIVRTMIDAVPTAYDLDKAFSELKTDSSVKLYGSQNSDNYMIPVKRAIEIVKHGGVADDVCEWEVFDNSLTDEPQWVYETTCGKYAVEEHTSKAFAYCPYCGKKIKIVGD